MEEEERPMSQEEIDFQRAIDRAAQHVAELERLEMEERSERVETMTEAELDEIFDSPNPVTAPNTMSDEEFRAAIHNSQQQEVPPPASNQFQEMFEEAEMQRVKHKDIDSARIKKPVAKRVSKGKKFLDTITTILNRYCGEENWSIDKQSSYVNSGYHVLQIKWPVIHMTNRNRAEHTLKDMVVGLPLRTGDTVGEFIDSIYGMRHTLSNVEAACGYRHSHLYGNSNGLQPFCTGSDSINDLWTSLKMDGLNSNDFDIRFEGFLHQLEAFLSYESIEGVPYFRINNIAYRNRGGLNSGVQSREIRNIVTGGVLNHMELSLDFNEATVRIVETDELHSLMAAEVEHHQRRMDNGTYVAMDDSTTGSQPGRHIDMDPVIWKGESIKTYVEPIHREEDRNVKDKRKAKRYAHSQITNGLFRAIEQRGEEYLRVKCEENHTPVKDEKEGASSYWRRADDSNTFLSRIETVERVVRPAVLEDERGGSGSGETGDDSN